MELCCASSCTRPWSSLPVTAASFLGESTRSIVHETAKNMALARICDPRPPGPPGSQDQMDRKGVRLRHPHPLPQADGRLRRPHAPVPPPASGLERRGLASAHRAGPALVHLRGKGGTGPAFAERAREPLPEVGLGSSSEQWRSVHAVTGPLLIVLAFAHSWTAGDDPGDRLPENPLGGPALRGGHGVRVPPVLPAAPSQGEGLSRGGSATRNRRRPHREDGPARRGGGFRTTFRDSFTS